MINHVTPSNPPPSEREHSLSNELEEHDGSTDTQVELDEDEPEMDSFTIFADIPTTSAISDAFDITIPHSFVSNSPTSSSPYSPSSSIISSQITPATSKKSRAGPKSAILKDKKIEELTQQLDCATSNLTAQSEEAAKKIKKLENELSLITGLFKDTRYKLHNKEVVLGDWQRAYQSVKARKDVLEIELVASRAKVSQNEKKHEEEMKMMKDRHISSMTRVRTERDCDRSLNEEAEKRIRALLQLFKNLKRCAELCGVWSMLSAF